MLRLKTWMCGNGREGSAAELRTQAYIAQRVNLLSDESLQEIVSELKEISAMLQGLIKYNKC